MRSAVLYHLYSGHLLFSAASLFLFAAVADLSAWLDRRPIAQRIGGFLAVLAIALGALSGTPMSLVLAVFALAATLAYAFAGFGAERKRRYLLGGAAIVAVMIVGGLELPYHVRHHALLHPSRLIVIGDSLSSGGFGERIAWPELLGRQLRIPVSNLALPSDTAAMALQNQVPLLPSQSHTNDCLIIEVGGNDMLEGLPAEQFEVALDRILIAARGKTVILLELPLLPGRWQYGMIQRRLAAKHGALLAPKRILAGVLLGRGNTSDGIHLLQPGHDALARELGRWIK